MSRKLYVGNLSFDTTEDTLKDHFAQVGSVASCSVIMDKFTQRSRGFAFVEMATPEEAQKAIEELDGKDFEGRSLRINIAKPREDRPPRDGGYR
jgi:cold-inducible RNA-binding protein